MRLLTKVGLGFTLAGVAVFAGWAGYLATRHYEPVNMPVSMSVGHVRTKEFRVNIKAPYAIAIEVRKDIPFDTLNCLLGMNTPSEKDCTGTPSVVNAEWTLISDGRVVQSGSSADSKGGAWANDTIDRDIGEFDGKPGHIYQVDVNILANGKQLAAGNPHLTVAVTSDFAEGAMFMSGLIIYPTVGVLLLIGVALLLVSFISSWWDRRKAKLAMHAL